MTATIHQATKKEAKYIRNHFGLSFAHQFKGTIVWEEIQGRRCHLHLDPETDKLMIIFTPTNQPQTTAAPAIEFAETAADMDKMITAELMIRKFAA